jgi:hypothetical protein
MSCLRGRVVRRWVHVGKEGAPDLYFAPHARDVLLALRELRVGDAEHLRASLLNDPVVSLDMCQSKGWMGKRDALDTLREVLEVRLERGKRSFQLRRACVSSLVQHRESMYLFTRPS